MALTPGPSSCPPLSCPSVQRARHIEVQIFGDGQGNVVAFPERECSIQVGGRAGGVGGAGSLAHALHAHAPVSPALPPGPSPYPLPTHHRHLCFSPPSFPPACSAGTRRSWRRAPPPL
jgi:hypothetical protein